MNKKGVAIQCSTHNPLATAPNRSDLGLAFVIIYLSLEDYQITGQIILQKSIVLLILMNLLMQLGCKYKKNLFLQPSCINFVAWV